MALKLKGRELPTIQFRRVLPEYLGPTDKDGNPVECFIEFDARAGGAINARHVALLEKGMLSARVMARKGAKIEDDKEFIEADVKTAQTINKSRFAALYDACVIEWRSNIQTEGDDGKVSDIDCDRATFLELCEVKVPELSDAIHDLESEVIKAGKAIKKDDDAAIKN